MIDIDGVLFDLDGVLWRRYHVSPGAAAVVAALRRESYTLGVITNTSARSGNFICRRLRSQHLPFRREEITTSSDVAAYHITVTHGGTIPVVCIGKYGSMRRSLSASGLNTISVRGDVPRVPLVVCAGYAERLERAEAAGILRIAPDVIALYATERDLWFGAADGPEPGAAWVVAAIEELLGRPATTLGKPNPLAVSVACKRLGLSPSRTIIVGDSLDSDVACAAAAGALSCLLRDERTRRGATRGEYEPNFEINNLKSLIKLIL